VRAQVLLDEDDSGGAGVRGDVVLGELSGGHGAG
jgi:hypothetical protein